MSSKEFDTAYMEQPAKRWEFVSLEDKVINQSKLLESFNTKLEVLLRSQVTMGDVNDRLKQHSEAVVVSLNDHKKEIDAKYGVIRAAVITVAATGLAALVTTAIAWMAQRLGGS